MKYFAYGSNMLTERLKARCKSATPTGSAFIEKHKVVFTKRSIDKSGKATLINTGNKKDIALGVLFEIDDTEEQELDEIEKGYISDNTFSVVHDGKIVSNVKTYTAPEDKCEAGLPVYDWYLALVVAGCNQHRLSKEYTSKMIMENKASRDLDDTRKSKVEALDILKRTGFEKVLSELNYQLSRSVVDNLVRTAMKALPGNVFLGFHHDQAHHIYSQTLPDPPSGFVSVWVPLLAAVPLVWSENARTYSTYYKQYQGSDGEAFWYCVLTILIWVGVLRLIKMALKYISSGIKPKLKDLLHF